MAFAINKGLGSAAVRSVPDKWDAEWFRRFVTNYLQFADVRNANAAGGVSITGNVVIPGTISIGSTVQPTNSFYAGPSSGPPATPVFRLLVSADIPCPLTLNAPSGQSGIILNGGTFAAAELHAAAGNVAALELYVNSVFQGQFQAAGGALTAAANGIPFQITTDNGGHVVASWAATTGALTLSPTGATDAVTINAPSGQSGLVVNGATFGAVELGAALGNTAAYEVYVNAVFMGAFQAGGGVVTVAADGVPFQVTTDNGVHTVASWAATTGALALTPNGAVVPLTIAAPSGQSGILVNGVTFAAAELHAAAGNVAALELYVNSVFQGQFQAAGGALTAAANGIPFQITTDNGSTTVASWAATTGALTLSPLGVTQFALSAAGDITARGVARCVFKAADTSRSNTITPTADPELAIVLTAGTYRYDAVLQMIAGASGATPGMQFKVAYTGTVADGKPWAGVGFVGGAGFATGGPFVNAVTNINLDTFTDTLYIAGVLTVSNGGTLSISWAQKTSSASTTTLQLGSMLTVTKLS